MVHHRTVFILRFKKRRPAGRKAGRSPIPRGLTVSGVIARVPRLLASNVEVENTGTKAG